MSRADKIGFLANLESCKAQQSIHLGNYDPCDYRGVYSLWLAAYDEEDLARRAQSRAAEAFVDRSCRQAR